MRTSRKQRSAAGRSGIVLRIACALVIATGFSIALRAVWEADWPQALIGGAATMAAVAAGFIGSRLLRLHAGLAAHGDRLRAMEERIERLERAIVCREEATESAPSTPMVNLSAIGRGDPSPLVAATLGRSTFPRLMDAMEEGAPVDSARHNEQAQSDAAAPATKQDDPDDDGSRAIPRKVSTS